MGLYFNIALFLPFNNFEGNLIFVKGYVIDVKNEVNESENKSKEYSIRVNAFDSFKLFKSIKLKVYTKEKLRLGDEVIVRGAFTQGDVRRNYKGFDYRNYLRQNGIYGIINVQDDCLKVIGKNNNLETVFMKIKERVNSSLEEYFEIESLGFFQSLLFGNKNNLSQETKDLFKDTSISGMHVGIVLISFENILKKVSNNKRLNYYLEIMFLIFFYILTGMQVSCFRSALFNIFMIVSKLRYEKSNIVKTVIYTYFILILMNVYNLINIGMYLSFLSSVSIMVFNKVFLRIYEYKVERNKRCLNNNNNNNFMYNFFKSNFIVSLSAQILILPIMIYNFNFFSLNFILSNLFISVFIPMLLKVGYIIVLIDIVNFFRFKFFIFINKMISKCLSIILEFNFFILEGIRKIDFLNIVFKTPNILLVIIYYLIAVSLIRWFNNNLYKNYKNILRFNYKKDIKILSKNIFKIFLKNKKIIIVLIIFIVFNNISALFQNKRFKFVFYRCGAGRLYSNKIRYK